MFIYQNVETGKLIYRSVFVEQEGMNPCGSAELVFLAIVPPLTENLIKFDKFLDDYNCKDRFFENMKQPQDKNFKNLSSWFEENKDDQNLMFKSFLWDTSPEGFSYWADLYEKFIEL